VVEGPSAGPGPNDAAGPDVHDERHELLVASLLDRRIQAAERAIAEQLLSTCAACASLHADLVALAVATRELPVAARQRDFRLTATDAARSRSIEAGDGEPHGSTSRLTGEMDVPDADHDRHDRLLIASLLDRSVDGGDRAQAESLIATCDDCATLHRDLLSLRDATKALPTPPRPRDFTISVEAAARLRRTGWRRLVAAFGSTRDAFSRPLAIGLTTLGLAGLLVSAIPGILPGATGSSAAAPTLGQAAGGAGVSSESLEGTKAAPNPSAAPSAAGPVAAALPAPSSAPSAPPEPAATSTEPAPSGEAFDTFVGAPAASAGAAAIAPEPSGSAQRDGADRAANTSIGAETTTSVDRVAVMGLAALLLAGGLGLFALRWVGRRV